MAAKRNTKRNLSTNHLIVLGFEFLSKLACICGFVRVQKFYFKVNGMFDSWQRPCTEKEALIIVSAPPGNFFQSDNIPNKIIRSVSGAQGRVFLENSFLIPLSA